MRCTHNLDTVFDVADRIVVLRLGRREATFERRATTREDVVAAIVGAHVQRTEAIARGTTDEHRLTPPMRGQHATRSVVAMSTTTEPAERSRVDDVRMGRRLAATHHGSGRRPRDCASAQRLIERRPR